MYKFRYKTGDGEVILPDMTIRYTCKGCESINELILLIGRNSQFFDPTAPVPYESTCAECGDVEVITFEEVTGAEDV